MSRDCYSIPSLLELRLQPSEATFHSFVSKAFSKSQTLFCTMGCCAWQSLLAYDSHSVSSVNDVQQLYCILQITFERCCRFLAFQMCAVSSLVFDRGDWIRVKTINCMNWPDFTRIPSSEGRRQCFSVLCPHP